MGHLRRMVAGMAADLAILPVRIRACWARRGVPRPVLLSALALAVGDGAPLPRTLVAYAAGDPALGRALAPLIADLLAGLDLRSALHRAALIGPGETLGGTIPQAMARLARQAVDPLPATWWIAHLPAVAMVVCAVPAMGVAILVSGILGNAYAEMGIKLPALTSLLMDLGHQGWWKGLQILACAVAVVEVIHRVLASLRGLRHILHAWALEVMRQQALLELLHAVRSGDAVAPAPPSKGLDRLLAWTWAGSWRSGHPHWDRTWRTWLFLTRFRLAAADRRTACSLPDLGGRLMALGLIAMTDQGPDLEQAEALAEARLRRAVRRSTRILAVVLFSACIVGIGVGVLPFFWPFLTMWDSGF